MCVEISVTFLNFTYALLLSFEYRRIKYVTSCSRAELRMQSNFLFSIISETYIVSLNFICNGLDWRINLQRRKNNIERWSESLNVWEECSK